MLFVSRFQVDWFSEILQILSQCWDKSFRGFLQKNWFKKLPQSHRKILVILRYIASFKHMSEAAAGRVNKKTCSKKFRNIYRKTPVVESLFNKVAGLKNTHFEEYLQAAASDMCRPFSMWVISLQPLTTFTNRSLLDVRQGSEYASVSVFTVWEPIFHEISGNIDPERSFS